MARAYSVDLRERVLRAEAAGLAPSEIERTLGISRRTLARWRHRLAAGESLRPGQGPGRPRKIAGDQEAALRARVAARPAAPLAARCDRWRRDHGVAVSPATMCRALARIAWPLKKNGGRAGARSGGAGGVSGDARVARSDPGARPR
jgi:transposase